MASPAVWLMSKHSMRRAVQRGFVRVQFQRFGQRQRARGLRAGFGQRPRQRHLGVLRAPAPARSGACPAGV